MPIEISPSNIKSIAKNLKTALLEYNLELKHSQSFEILANALGYKDWNTLSAKINEISLNRIESRAPDEAPLHERPEYARHHDPLDRRSCRTRLSRAHAGQRQHWALEPLVFPGRIYQQRTRLRRRHARQPKGLGINV